MQENINIPDSTITSALTFRNLVLMNMQQLTNFPYIEKDFDALTDYELLCLVVKFLNDVIANQNEQNDSITNMYNAFLALQTYVNNTKDTLEDAFNTLDNYVRNYFDNLDVQDEIDHKLDEMVEDGTLLNIIASYLQTQKIYNTYVEMVADAANLTNGLRVQTLGYYNINDGGGAFYVISNTADVTKYQEVVGSFYAEMIIENETINFRQLGAKPDDNTFDNKNYLLKYQTICNTLGKQIRLIIPSGSWYFSPTHLSRIGGFNIEGIGSSSTIKTFISTRIIAIDNQDYVWKFGGTSDMGSTTLAADTANTMNRLKGLTFESALHTITYGCLVLEHSCYGFYDEILFNNIVGTGLYIRSCWENYFGIMTFRGIQDFSSPCMRLAPIRAVTGLSANISATTFDKLMFENTAGDLIKSDLVSEFVHCQIGQINVEYGYNLRDGETLGTITSETDYSEFTPMFLINGNGDGITIDTINWTGTSSIYRYAITSSGNYYFKSLFNSIGGGTTQAYRFSYNIGKISSRSLIQILTAISPYPDGFIFYLGSYIETAASDAGEIAYSRFDCKNIGQIDIGSIRTKLRYGVRAVMENAIELYKYGYQGSISTDDDSWSKPKLVVERYGNNQLNLKMNYPFPYDESKSSHWILRIKTTDAGSYYFTLRGFHNGSQVNQTYSASGLSADTWITIPITMNYDFGSQIIIVQPNCKFDTLTYVSWE